MSEQGSSNTGEKQSSPPYEAALNKAFDKLTSEILIFLLAYTILLIGLAVFGSGIATQFRNLLYIIPVLGVVAYVTLLAKGRQGRRGRW
jgi:hypothetical protein